MSQRPKFGRKKKHVLDPDIAEEIHSLRKHPRKKCSPKKPSTALRAKKVRISSKSSKDKGKTFRSSSQKSIQKEHTSMKTDDRDAEIKGGNQVPVARSERSDDAST